MAPLPSMLIAVVCSVLYACVFFVFIDSTLYRTPAPVLIGVINGLVVGLFPVSLITSFVVLRVKVAPALFACLGGSIFTATLGLGLLGADYFVLSGGVGLCVGAVLAYLFGPRIKVYRYARCPGCGYNLALLPKSDVCPECGRDNTDLVEVFSDLDLGAPAPSAKESNSPTG